MNKLILFQFSLLLSVIMLSANAQEAVKDTLENNKRYDQLKNYYNNQFKPFKKSDVFIGLAVSLEDKKITNTDYLLEKVLDGSQLDYNILLKGGFFIRDYSMLLLNLSYYQDKFGGQVFRSPDTLQSNSITRGFTLTPAFRSALPLTHNERLSFFTEIGLAFGHSNTLTRNISHTDEIDKSYGSEFNFRVGLSPGITFFAVRNFAIELQLNVLGYQLKIKESSKNNGPDSRQVAQNVDFNINLLSLQLGLAYYFN